MILQVDLVDLCGVVTFGEFLSSETCSGFVSGFGVSVGGRLSIYLSALIGVAWVGFLSLQTPCNYACCDKYEPST